MSEILTNLNGYLGELELEDTDKLRKIKTLVCYNCITIERNLCYNAFETPP